MKTLKHNDIVYSTKFGIDYMALVGTVEDYAIECEQSAEEAVQRAVSNRHNLAWANTFCVVIDDTGHAYRRHQERKAKAIPLEQDEIVMVRDRKYAVHLTRVGNQDMIQLIPVGYLKLSKLAKQIRALARQHVGGVNLKLELGTRINRVTDEANVNSLMLDDDEDCDLFDTSADWDRETIEDTAHLDFYCYAWTHVGRPQTQELRDNFEVMIRRGRIDAVKIVGSDWVKV